MISDRYECIFIHIPRCAGTSVEEVVWHGVREERELWMGFVDRYHNRHQTGGLQHLFARQISCEVGEPRFSSYFKFTVVRNPFDRLVSQFAYMDRRPDLRAFIGMDGHATFDEYLSLISRKRHVQWEPQTSFIYDEDGKLLVDFIGRFEHLGQSMAYVFERLGLSGMELPHLNGADRAPYRDYYTEELRLWVESLYERDLALLGYEF